MAKPTTTIQILLLTLFVILVGFGSYKSFKVTSAVSGDNYWKELDELEAKQRSALAADKNSPDSLPARQLAETLWQQKKFTEAEKLLSKGTSKAKPTGYDSQFVDTTLELAAFLLDKGDFPGALKRYESIYAYDREMLGSASREVARDLNDLGVATYLAGQTKQEEQARKAYFSKACNYYWQAAAISNHLGNDQDTLWRLERILSNRELARRDLTKANQLPFDRVSRPNNQML